VRIRRSTVALPGAAGLYVMTWRCGNDTSVGHTTTKGHVRWCEKQRDLRAALAELCAIFSVAAILTRTAYLLLAGCWRDADGRRGVAASQLPPCSLPPRTPVARYPRHPVYLAATFWAGSTNGSTDSIILPCMRLVPAKTFLPEQPLKVNR
jgi:hypothetical protein